jgi:hypothetical protein
MHEAARRYGYKSLAQNLLIASRATKAGPTHLSSAGQLVRSLFIMKAIMAVTLGWSLALLFACLAIRGLQTGVIRYKLWRENRKSSPFWFWFFFMLCTLWTVLGVASGIYFIFNPIKN